MVDQHALGFLLGTFAVIWLRRGIVFALHYLLSLPLAAVLFLGYGVIGALCGVTIAELKEAYLPDGRKSDDQRALRDLWIVVAAALVIAGVLIKIFFFR